MEIVMCTSCYELYRKNKIVKNENDNYYCPKPNCCSGHPGLEAGEVRPYIFFKAWSVPDTLPEGWEYDKFDRSKQCTITFDIEKIGYWQGLENLHKWAIALPKIKKDKNIEEDECNDN